MIRPGLLGLLLLALTVGCVGQPTVAPQPEKSLGQALTLTSACSGCHAKGNEVVGSLDVYSAAQLRTLLVAYRDSPGGTAMHRMAKGFSDTEIEMIAKRLGN